MIVSVMRSGPAGTERQVLDYVLSHDVEHARATNTGIDDARESINAIVAHNEQNRRPHAVSRVEHMVASFPQGEKPTPEQLAAIEDRLMTRIGFGDHPRISALHRPDGGRVDNWHLHIACSRIDPQTRKAEHPHWNYCSLQHEAARLELDLGLTVERKTLLDRERHEIEQRRSLDRAHAERHPDPPTPAAPAQRQPMEQPMSEARQRDEIRERDEAIVALRINTQNLQTLRDDRIAEMSLLEKAGDRSGWRPDEQLHTLDRELGEASERLKDAVSERLRSMSAEARIQEMRLDIGPDGRPLGLDGLARETDNTYREVSLQAYDLQRGLLAADRDLHWSQAQFNSLDRQHAHRWADMNTLQRLAHETGIWRDRQLDGIERDMANLVHDAGARMADRAELATGFERVSEVKAALYRELQPDLEHRFERIQERAREAREYARQHEREHEHDLGWER